MIAIPQAAAAQTPAPSATAAGDLESARELFKEAREARQSGDLQRARDKFRAAHAYGQTPVTALELGRTHIQLRELVEGREVLLSVARMRVQPDETEKSEAARAEAASLADEVKKRISTISVRLSGPFADSAIQLSIDGALVPVVGLAGIRKTNPGKHVIVARAGAHEESRTVDVEEGKVQDVSILLAAQDAPLISPPRSGRTIGTVTWIGLGVGVVGAAVGTIAGVVALGKKSDVDKACSGLQCPLATKAVVDSGRSAATVSTIGFAIGIAGVVTAAVGYFVLSKPTAVQGRAVQVAPFVTASALGLDVIGSRF